MSGLNHPLFWDDGLPSDFATNKLLASMAPLAAGLIAVERNFGNERERQAQSEGGMNDHQPSGETGSKLIPLRTFLNASSARRREAREKLATSTMLWTGKRSVASTRPARTSYQLKKRSGDEEEEEEEGADSTGTKPMSMKEMLRPSFQVGGGNVAVGTRRVGGTAARRQRGKNAAKAMGEDEGLDGSESSDIADFVHASLFTSNEGAPNENDMAGDQGHNETKIAGNEQVHLERRGSGGRKGCRVAFSETIGVIEPSVDDEEESDSSSSDTDEGDEGNVGNRPTSEMGGGRNGGSKDSDDDSDTLRESTGTDALSVISPTSSPRIKSRRVSLCDPTMTASFPPSSLLTAPYSPQSSQQNQQYPQPQATSLLHSNTTTHSTPYFTTASSATSPPSSLSTKGHHISPFISSPTSRNASAFSRPPGIEPSQGFSSQDSFTGSQSNHYFSNVSFNSSQPSNNTNHHSEKHNIPPLSPSSVRHQSSLGEQSQDHGRNEGEEDREEEEDRKPSQDQSKRKKWKNEGRTEASAIPSMDVLQTSMFLRLWKM